MKTHYFTIFVLTLSISLFSSCEKDAESTLPGAWETSDGGTITFNVDGTGTTMDSPFFLWDCGLFFVGGNPEYIGPVTTFEWRITQNKENLFLEFDDQTSFYIPCTGTKEFPIKVKNKNKATVGFTFLGTGSEIDITKQ